MNEVNIGTMEFKLGKKVGYKGLMKNANGSKDGLKEE